MTSLCTIEFRENQSKIFYSGHVLRGYAVITAAQNENHIKSISVIITGNGSWKVGKHSFTEDYIKHETAEIRLISDTNIYPFEYVLPPDLPSSVKTPYGNVEYHVCVVLNTDSCGFVDKVTDTFTVVKALDLNEHPSLLQPAKIEKTLKAPNSLLVPWKSKSLNIIAQLPATGFLTEQMIDLGILVEHKDCKDFYGIVVKLKQSIHFRKGRRYQTTLDKQRIMKHEMNAEHKASIKIDVPASVPSSDTNPNISCKIEYYIQIDALVSSARINPKLRIPIKIGTNPVESVNKEM